MLTHQALLLWMASLPTSCWKLLLPYATKSHFRRAWVANTDVGTF